MPSDAWIKGPPPGRGRWWIVWNAPGEPVEAVEIGPALIHRHSADPPLLVKCMNGEAFRFDNARVVITHHMPLTVPMGPDPKEGR